MKTIDEPVFAGIGGDIIKKFSDILFKGLDFLFKNSVDIDDIKETDEGLKFVITTGGDHKLDVTCDKNSDGTFDVHIVSRDKRKRTYDKKNVAEKDFDTLFTNVIDDWYGETYEGVDDEEDIEESTQISSKSFIMCFTKVSEDDEYTVNVTKCICEPDNIADTTDAFNTIIQDDEFLDTLPEGKSTFEILPSENRLEVTELDPEYCDDSYNPYIVILAYAMRLRCHALTFSWNAQKGSDRCIADSAQRIYDSICWQMYDLALMSYIKYGYAPDVVSLINTDPGIDVSKPIDKDSAFSILSYDLDNYKSALNMMILNVSEEDKYAIFCKLKDCSSLDLMLK